MSNLPWYKEGLRFQCTECGGCCTGSPGYVWVEVEEIQRMADHLQLSIEEFSRRYLRKVGQRWSLRELPKKEWACVFLEGKRCSIYSVRPKQCRTFPWWKGNLKSPEHWKAAAEWCEGIRDDAPLVEYEEIERELAKQEAPQEPFSSHH